MAFHPNGNYIASGSSDKTCRLWDLQSGQFVRVFVGHKVNGIIPVYVPGGPEKTSDVCWLHETEEILERH